MTDDLQQARVEAAARAIYNEWRSPDYFTWEQAVEGRNANPDPTFPHIVDRVRGQARAALAAADAVAKVPPLHRDETEPVAANPLLRGVDLAIDRLIRRDCFTERTLRVLDELREEITRGEVAGDE